jgi:hypothetical protein
MSVIDRQIQATHVPPAPEPRSVVGTEPHRAARRPPASIEQLADRIRALERAEPLIGGDLRTSVLAELALIQLRAERLSLDAWRTDEPGRRTNDQAAVLAEHLDRLSVHWPLEAEPGPIVLEPPSAPNESVTT